MPPPALLPPVLRALTLAIALGGGLCAADGPATAAPSTAPLPSSPSDPTATVVAEGRETYRQRDLDALVVIATRYHHGAFSAADEDQLRHALVRILIAREPLLDSLAALPPAVAAGKAGDAFLLDVLDYRTQAGPSAAIEPAAASPAPVATEPVPLQNPALPAADAPVIVPLPPLVVVRTMPDQVKRSLQLQLALRFADEATSQRIGAQAPIIRDAILGFLDGLPNADFLEPKQQSLKQGITAAIIAQLPSFPPNAVLIPQVDAERVSDSAPAATPTHSSGPSQ